MGTHYPWVKNLFKSCPYPLFSGRVLTGTHTHCLRVGYPRVPIPMGKTDIPMLAAPTCNYYEIGITSLPLYVSNTIKLQETTYTMYWPLLDVRELFFYDMPMHRKRIRLRHCMIYVALCSLLNHKSLLIKIAFDIPWDLGGFIT